MGRLYEAIDDTMRAWIGRQPMFFVATAPLAADGHVNVSPKGSRDTLRVLGPTRVAYLDLQGSGIETTAHLRENGRITLMFCAFDGPPKIVRLHGRGRVVQRADPEFDGLLAAFQPGAELLSVLRSIVVVDVTRVSDSCGFVVPRMDYVGERPQIYRWAEGKRRQHGDAWQVQYQQANNAASIDGLPGLDLAGELSEEELARHTSVGRAL